MALAKSGGPRLLARPVGHPASAGRAAASTGSPAASNGPAIATAGPSLAPGEAPRIVVNAKAYLEVSSAAGCLRLARACARAADATGARIALAPPLAELATLARHRSIDIPLYGQHCDAREPGAATGWVTAEALAAAGAMGSIVNHAEHKLPHSDVERIVSRLSAAGLASLVCADSLAEARALAAFKPTMLAVEPPELIGGDVSVTSADPAIVGDVVKAVRKVAPKTLVLCGAGVKTGADVAAALRLGAHGVLLASGVVKANHPLAALKGLAGPLTPPSRRAR